MKREHGMDRTISAWLEEGPNDVARWVIQDAVNEARQQPQVRSRPAWREAFARRSQRWSGLAMIAVIVLVAVLGFATARLPAMPGTAPPEPTPSMRPTPTTVPAPTDAGAVPTPVTVATQPDAVIPIDNRRRSISLTAIGGQVWATSEGGATLIDTRTDETEFLALPGDDESRSLRADSESVWMTDYYGQTVYRLDPATGQALAELAIDGNPRHLTIGDGSVWVWLNDGRTIEIDARTNSVVGEPLPYRVTAYGQGRLWVSEPGSILQIDPRTREVVATIEAPALPSRCYVSGEFPQSVWGWCGLNPINPIVTRIDPVSNTSIATVDIGGLLGSIDGVVIVEGEPWFPVMPGPVPGTPGRLVRVGPATNRVDRVITLGSDFDPNDAVVTGNALWVSNESTQEVWRIPLSALNGE